MSFYLTYIKNKLRTAGTYKINSILRMLNRFIFMVVQIEIWKLVYGYDFTKKITSNYGYISLNNMIFYTIMSHIIFILIQSNSLKDVNNKISTGDIALQLNKPYNFFTLTLADSVGESLIALLLQAVPLLLFAVVFFHSTVSLSLSHFIIFIFSLINGFMIYFLLNFILSLVSFWVVQTGPLEMILSGLIKIFSGVWIPLWFFGETMTYVSSFLPFEGIYFIPLSILIGKMNNNDMIYHLIQQMIWIIILFAIEKIIWRSGINKLVLQGG